MKIKKINTLCLVYLILIISNLLFPIFLKSTLSIQILSLIFGIVSVIELLLGMYIWYKKNGTLNSAFIYFILSCYVCWFGQIVVCGLNLLPKYLVDITNFASGPFIHTGTFALIGFGALFFGGILKYENKTKVIENKKVRNKNLSKALLIVGLLMIIISVFGHYYDLISKLIISLKYGYASLYEQVKAPSPIYNIFSNLKMFFWPGMFFLLMACKGNKKVFNIVLGIALVDIILNFVIGSRSDALVIILAMFWFYTNEYKSIKVKGYMGIVVILIILLHLISTIASFRLLPNKTLLLFVKELFNFNNNAIVKTINEFGFNIFSLHHTMLLIPSTKFYSLGYTYFASIMAIIPSALMGGFSFSTAAGLPDWLKTSLNMDYGPGYSILAESFYNFGYFGIFAMFIIGILAGKLVSNRFKGDKKIVKNGIIAIIIYLNIFIARDTFLMVFRKMFYTLVIPLLLVWFFYKIYKNKSKNKFYIKFKNISNKTYLFFNKLENK